MPFVTGKETEKDMVGWLQEEKICYQAICLFKAKTSPERVAQLLKLSISAAEKIELQFKKYGRVHMPKSPRPDNLTELLPTMKRPINSYVKPYQKPNKQGSQGYGSRLPNQTA